MKAKVKVTLKTGVLRPARQGHRRCALASGICRRRNVRQGKYFEIELAETDKAKAEAAGESHVRKVDRQYGD